MNIEDIRNSGLLELYVIGDISDEDRRKVELALEESPRLKEELKEIEKALAAYASTVAITPNVNVKSQLLDEIRNQNKKIPNSGINKKSPGNKFFLGLLIAGTLGLFTALMYQNNNLADQLNTIQIRCDSIEADQNRRLLVYQELQDNNNQIVSIQATDKYPETALYFHHNTSTKRNFIQINNLPAIAADQSYQLWSLKGDQAIPLDVFQGTDGLPLEVQYEDGTDAYAITIEPLGGLQSPTLENLIGVIPVT